MSHRSAAAMSRVVHARSDLFVELVPARNEFEIWRGSELSLAMALTIKNAEVERLAAEVARLAGESKIEAIRRALDERLRRLEDPSLEQRRKRVMRFLEEKVWPTPPAGELDAD